MWAISIDKDLLPFEAYSPLELLANIWGYGLRENLHRFQGESAGFLVNQSEGVQIFQEPWWQLATLVKMNST